MNYGALFSLFSFCIKIIQFLYIEGWIVKTPEYFCRPVAVKSCKINQDRWGSEFEARMSLTGVRAMQKHANDSLS